MEQSENQRIATGEQLHTDKFLSIEQSGMGTNINEPTDEELFFCTHGNHSVPRSQAAKKGDKPSICKACSAERRDLNRQRDEDGRAQKQASIDRIPSIEQRGENKRVTFSLSQYTLTALEVLAVGTTPSQVVERAVVQLLQHDPQAIAFVGHMFQKMTTE